MRDKGVLREIYDRWNLWTPVMAEEFNDYDPPKVEPARATTNGPRRTGGRS